MWNLKRLLHVRGKFNDAAVAEGAMTNQDP